MKLIRKPKRKPLIKYCFRVWSYPARSCSNRSTLTGVTRELPRRLSWNWCSGLNGICSQMGVLVLALGGGMFRTALEAHVLVLATSAVPPWMKWPTGSPRKGGSGGSKSPPRGCSITTGERLWFDPKISHIRTKLNRPTKIDSSVLPVLISL